MTALGVLLICAGLTGAIALIALWMEAVVNTTWILVLRPKTGWIAAAVAIATFSASMFLIPSNPKGPTLWLNVLPVLFATPLITWPLSNLIAKWAKWSFLDLESDRKPLGVLRFQIFDLVLAEQRVTYKPPHRGRPISETAGTIPP